MVDYRVKLKNILGLSYYRYELTSSNYNPKIDSSITLTAHVTDIFGNNAASKPIQLYKNNTSMGSSFSGNTNSSGVITFTVTCSDWGVQDFSISNTHCQVNVQGWKVLQTKQDGTKVWSNG